MQLTPDFITYLAGLWIGFWLGVIAMMGFNWLWKHIEKRRRQESIDFITVACCVCGCEMEVGECQRC